MPGRRLKLAFGLGLAAIGLWLAFRQAPIPEVWRVLASARPGPLAAAAAAIVGATALRAWRWQRLFPLAGQPVRFSRLWPILVVAQMVNILVPARAGDVGRIFAIERTEQRAPGETLGTLALEKTVDGLVFVAFLIVASLSVELPGFVSEAGLALAGALGMAVLAIALAGFAGTPALAAIERSRVGSARFGRRLVESWLRPLVGALSSRWRAGRVVTVLGLSVLVWGTAAGANYFCLAAVGLEPTAVAALVVLLVVQLGTAVPLSPGGLGVFEYLSVLALSLFAVPRAEALGFALLLHAVAYLTPVALGALFVVLQLAPRPVVGESRGPSPEARVP